MNTPAQPGPEQFAMRCAERVALAYLVGFLDPADWVAQAGWDADRGVYYLHAVGKAEAHIVEVDTFGAILLQLKELPGLRHIADPIASWRVTVPPPG